MTDHDDDHDWSEPDGADDLDAYFDGGGDSTEDDPWANVKTEDELKQTPVSEDDEPDDPDPDVTVGSDDSSSDGEDSDAGPAGDSDAGPAGDEDPFHERLAHALRSNGWMLNDFADASGYDVMTMGEFVSGETEPPADDREELMDVALAGPSSAGAADSGPDQNHQTQRDTTGGDTRPDAPPQNRDADVDFDAKRSPETASTPQVPDDDYDWEYADGGDADVSGEFIPDSVACSDCTHRQVCVVLNSFVPMLRDENWDAGTEEDGSPIDPMDMAKICDSYEPEGGDEAPEATNDH